MLTALVRGGKKILGLLYVVYVGDYKNNATKEIV